MKSRDTMMKALIIVNSAALLVVGLAAMLVPLRPVESGLVEAPAAPPAYMSTATTTHPPSTAPLHAGEAESP